MDEEAWLAGMPCEDDDLPHCGRCKPTHLPDVVYISKGGYAFHRSPDCSDLLGGQQRIAGLGNQPSEIEAVALQVALGKSRTPCIGCLPGENLGKRQRDWPRPKVSAGDPCTCGGHYELRRRRYDGREFLGCSRFPECKKTWNP